MRIVSGKYGGRVLDTPKNHDIRPTLDKIRGAMFNALRARIDLDDCRVLDCFCGTGALGLEALSCGAMFAQFWDNNRSSLELAKSNAEMLGVGFEGVSFQIQDASKVGACGGARFDLAFLDPPYDRGLIVPTLEALRDGDWLADGAICVIEAEKSFADALPASFTVDAEKTYGDTKVLYLSYR